MKLVYNLILINLLTLLIVLSSCFPAMYYSPRICEPGERYVGVSALGYVTNFQKFTNAAWYSRWGLPYGFDAGVDIQFSLFFPYTISASIRKQFNLNNEFIDGITFGISYGDLIQKQTMLTTSILSEDLGITGGIGKYSENETLFSLSSFSDSYTVNSIFLQFSYDNSYGDIHIMPYLYYNYSMRKSDWENPWYLYSFINRSGITSYHTIGIGISYYKDN